MHRIEPALRATELGPMTTTSGHAYDGHRASGAAARVGDADRDRAAALLNDATGAGYLRLDELEERLDRILRARTRGELDTALADLPREWLRERSRAEAVAGARRLARAAPARTSRRTPSACCSWSGSGSPSASPPVPGIPGQSARRSAGASAC